MSVTSFPEDHFHGGANLNKGARKAPDDRTMREGLNEIVVQANANELGAQDEGSVAVAQLIFAGQPSNTDTLDIGGDTYQFLTTPAGATSDIEVDIAASAELTIDELVLAINGAAGLNDAVASENLLAVKGGTTICKIRSAAAVGGAVAAADPDILLDASGQTNGSWDVGDVNMNTLAGKAAAQRESATVVLPLTAAMLTATHTRVSFPFTPVAFELNVRSATGLPITAATAETALIDGDDILLGSLGTDWSATDVVTITAYSA